MIQHESDNEVMVKLYHYQVDFHCHQMYHLQYIFSHHKPTHIEDIHHLYSVVTTVTILENIYLLPTIYDIFLYFFYLNIHNQLNLSQINHPYHHMYLFFSNVSQKDMYDIHLLYTQYILFYQ